MKDYYLKEKKNVKKKGSWNTKRHRNKIPVSYQGNGGGGGGEREQKRRRGELMNPLVDTGEPP